MAVCDLLGQYWVVRNGVPVNLIGQRPAPWRSNSESPRCPYIFEVLLLQYREEKSSHDVVIVGRHDDNVNGECSDESVEGPSKGEREVLPTVEERGALFQFELHGVLVARLEWPPAQDVTQFE